MKALLLQKALEVYIVLAIFKWPSEEPILKGSFSTHKKDERHLITATFYVTYWSEVLLHQLPDGCIGFSDEYSRSPEDFIILLQRKKQSLTSPDASKHIKRTGVPIWGMLYSCLICTTETNFWKQSLMARLAEGIRGFHSTSAVTTPLIAVIRSQMIL